MHHPTLFLLSFLLTITTPQLPPFPCTSPTSTSSCLQCPDSFFLSNDTCYPCSDTNCKHCYTSPPNKCFKCKDTFILTNKQCGIKCPSTAIPGCDICSPSSSAICLQCKYGCSFSNGQCSCSSRLLIIAVCVLVAVIVIVVVALCLTKVNFVRSNELIKLALDISSSQNDVISGNMNDLGVLSYDDVDDKKENEKDEKDKKVEIELNDVSSSHHHQHHGSVVTEGQELIAVSTENLDSMNIKRNLCDYCLIEYTDKMLKCGCYLCNQHNDIIIEDKCPICKKEI